MATVYYSDKPDQIKYMPLHDGRADVWLRKNITEVTETTDEGESSTAYTADEVYLRTSVSKETIEANFDEYYSEAESESSGDTEEITIEERITALEAAMIELAGDIASDESEE